MAAGFFDEAIHAYRGIPQSYYIDEFIDLERDPAPGYVLMPIAGFPVLDGGAAARLRPRPLPPDARLRAARRACSCCCTTSSEGSVERGASLGTPATSATRSTPRRPSQLAEGLRALRRGALRRRRAAGGRPLRPEPLVLERGDDLAAIARRGVRAGRDRDRLDPPAVHLPHGRRIPRTLGGRRLRRVPRRARPLRRRHERVSDLPRRAAADHDGGARRPHRPPHPRALVRARRVSDDRRGAAGHRERAVAARRSGSSPGRRWCSRSRPRWASSTS